MKTEPDGIPEDNNKVKKVFTTSFTPSNISDLDKRFFILYYSILVFIFANSIGSYQNRKANSIILIIGLSLSVFASVLSIIMILIEMHQTLKKHFKTRIYSALYIITGTVIVLTDPKVLSLLSQTNLSSASQCRFLLFPYYLLGSRYLIKSRLFYFLVSYLILVACFLLTWSMSSILLHILSYSLLSIFIYSLSSEIKVHTEIYDAIGSEEYSSFNILSPNTPLEEILSEIHEGIEKIMNISKSTPPTIQKIYRKLIKLLKSIMDKIQKTDNIYQPRIDLVTKNMDEEDKIYIEQECFEKISLEVNRFKRRQSEQKIIQRRPFEYGVSELSGFLRQIGKEWNFDSFFVAKCSKTPAVIVGKYTVKMYGLDELYKISDDVLDGFLNELESKYLDNPYHNSTHGADVMCSFSFFLTKSRLSDSMTTLEWLSGIVASLGHDVGHPGKNNRFLIMTSNEIAIQYNDISVLEMMHSSIIFQIVSNQSHNIFLNLTVEKFMIVRKLIIDMILATDMSKHFDLLSYMRTKYNENSDFNNKDIRADLFRLCIKSADVGHAAKNIELHEKWCYLVIEEFFTQGDEEKKRGLPVSMYCDRDNTNIAKSQAGFIKNIVLNLFTTLNFILASDEIEATCINQLKQNEAYWESLGKQRNLSSIQKSHEVKQKENILPILKRKSIRKGSLPPVYKPNKY